MRCRPGSRIALWTLPAAALLAAAAPARADWPTARHDPGRTGASASPSDITKPAQYWRAYLGGVLGSTAVLTGDTDSDGALDVLYVAGGRLILARPDGSALWQTQNLGFTGIIDVVDLDGAGGLDVVVVSGARASVVRGVTGEIVWQQDPTELGTLSAARIADLDEDGFPDLFLDRCGCCAVETSSPGVVYSFPLGFDAPVKSGAALPPRSHCGVASAIVGDWDGDGAADLLLPRTDSLVMVRGLGAQVDETINIAPFIGGARCEPAAVDDAPGDEAVCFQNTIVGNQGMRRVFVVTYRPGETPAAKVLWDVPLAPPVDGELRVPGRLVWDLDGDGALEIVASGKDAGAWTTSILDARTGALLIAQPGEVAQVVAPAQGGEPPLLFTSKDDVVSAFRFRRAPPALELAASLPERGIPTRLDRARGRVTLLNQAPVLVDLDDNDRPEILLETTTEPARLRAVRLEALAGEPGAVEYTPGAGVGVAALDVPSGVVTDVRLAVSRNDGYLALLDAGFTTVNLGQEGTETLPGMRAGAHYTGAGGLFTFGRAPLAARLSPGAGADSILVVDARGDLVRIDAADASNVSPAKPTWRAEDTFGAGVAPAADGAPARIGCFRKRHPVTEPAAYYIAALDADGAQLLDVPVAKPPAWDVLPGDLDGDGGLDFAALTADLTLATEVLALRDDGSPLWQRAIAGSYGTSPPALGDWDGDGADDVLVAINTARVYGGPSGDILADGGGFIAYFMPLLADVTGDDVPEVTLQGGVYGARTLTHDLSAQLWQGADDRPFPYGALAPCAGAPRLVEGSLKFPSRLTLTTTSGAGAGERTTIVLAGGQVFPDEATAEAAGVLLGQLGDAAVSANLGGADDQPTALVGSTDGFLYAVAACSGELRWAHPFDAPVGAPILADADGDGMDDILVSVADGYLYGLRQERLPAPELVWDVDIPGGLTGDDLDDITTEDALHAVWSPVPAATSYEVAVVGAAGTYLSTPAWTDVGDVTQVSIGDLQLDDGAKYYVGVRAVAPGAGRSPDRPSDGVIVHRPGGAGGGGAGGAGGAGAGGAGGGADELLLWGRGCACRTAAGGAGAPAAAWLSAWAVAAALRARRRARPLRRRGV